MNLFALIFGVGLFAPALSLTCYSCPVMTSETCLFTRECGAGQVCGAIATVTYMAGVRSPPVHSKACVPPRPCTTVTASFGSTKAVINTECCSKDLCNNNTAAEPSRGSPNGLKCYTCDKGSCKAILSCEGSEDRCISTAAFHGGMTTYVKGCVSKAVCDGLTGPLNTTFTSVHCCQTNLCNGGASVAASAPLLVASLLTAVLHMRH